MKIMFKFFRKNQFFKVNIGGRDGTKWKQETNYDNIPILARRNFESFP